MGQVNSKELPLAECRNGDMAIEVAACDATVPDGHLLMAGEKIHTLFLKVSALVLPLFIVLIFYLFSDPFKVIYHYKSFYPSFVVLNRDFVSTETFLHNNPHFHYDSFILGNSRSIFYEVGDWQKYISSTKCFHFDASAETLFGIYSKIKFLDANNVPLKNVLIIMDYGTLIDTYDSKGHLFIKHPLVSGKPWYAFHLEFVKAFFDLKFLIAYTDLSVSKRIKNYMVADCLLDDRPTEYNAAANEIKLAEFERIIKNNPTDYYLPRKDVFYERSAVQIYSPMAIRSEQDRMLREIKNIFMKNKTDYRIIVNPLYDQTKLNSSDLAYLIKVFGSDNVFDFSGINDITKNRYNYYEASHYRPHVARLILSDIYRNITQRERLVRSVQGEF